MFVSLATYAKPENRRALTLRLAVNLGFAAGPAGWTNYHGNGI
jgi:hypothetical protein